MEFTRFLQSKKAIVLNSPQNNQMLNTNIHPTVSSKQRKSYNGITIPSDDEMYNPEWINIISKLKLVSGKAVKEDFEDISSSSKFIIPPLNTNINFSKQLPRFIGVIKDHDSKAYTLFSTAGITKVGQEPPAGDPSHIRGKLHTHSHDHENFSWSIPTSHDDTETIEKKLLIHPVFDQQGCGSCWAVSVATTMSDCLVVGETVNHMPSISPTFCMACYPQEGCAGGMPAQLALDIQNNGVADTSCIDYSWCDDNKHCNVRGNTHFNINPQRLSNMIPTCGCSMDTDKQYYYLDPGTDTFSITNKMPYEHYRQLVRYHILDFGPVVGGYLVLNNFLDGNFSKINKGVYFDRADYDNILPDGTIPFSDKIHHHKNSKGLHAVSIVGWGLAKNIQYDNGKIGDVPFWFCRNSWGKQWGEQGYFKMAMYPFNKISQFDKVVTVKIDKKPVTIGGLMLIRATTPPRLKKNIKTN